MMTRVSITWLTAVRAIVHRDPTWLGRLLGYSERHDEMNRLRAPGGYVWLDAATNRDVPAVVAERLDREHALHAVRARLAALDRRV